MTGHVSAVSCRRLWAAVLYENIRVALGVGGIDVNRAEISKAKTWIGTRDFHTVCALAGIDGQSAEDWVKREMQSSDPGRVFKAMRRRR